MTRQFFKEAIEDYLSREEYFRTDFHTHSFLSDGVLLPMEQLRRAFTSGHQCYAITDHVSASNLDIIPKIIEDCKLATKHWDILALPGVELTHVPVAAMDDIIEKAREYGALVVVIHGETIAEPVQPGTNEKAANNKEVDILAHPGFLTEKEATLCEKNDVFVEITSRKGHNITNGHIVQMGKKKNVNFLQNTDTHSPQDMLTYSEGLKILKGAGLQANEAKQVTQENVRRFLAKIYDHI
ncbi:MAG: histidinol phosphate phosphatase domain-containing protein [Candidatus Heimdallarchaeota archaeon]|nr:histidinol phosphate phosphatase domain-containing protein [Candidatus Heimdallarchaeota archaeon]